MAGVNGRELCGVLCVNKPEGFTSFDVIAKLRGILKMKRLGHTGTLDPMATGVLPVLCGRAAKAADILPDHDKTYEAGFRFGTATDTQDCTGKVLSERDASGATYERLSEAVKKFRGEIMQIPPMYSAVSVGGKRLYELARQGREIEREPRKITVYSLEIKEYNESGGCGIFKISCSKGTYIRTLINDIGEALGCGGMMTSLVRTKACGFGLEDCFMIEQLQDIGEAEGDFSGIIKPIEDIFSCLPKLYIRGAQERMYRNGVKLDLNRIRLDGFAERIAVYGGNGFIGTAVPDRENGVLRVEKTFDVY